MAGRTLQSGGLADVRRGADSTRVASLLVGDRRGPGETRAMVDADAAEAFLVRHLGRPVVGSTLRSKVLIFCRLGRSL